MNGSSNKISQSGMKSIIQTITLFRNYFAHTYNLCICTLVCISSKCLVTFTRQLSELCMRVQGIPSCLWPLLPGESVCEVSYQLNMGKMASRFSSQQAYIALQRERTIVRMIFFPSGTNTSFPPKGIGKKISFFLEKKEKGECKFQNHTHTNMKLSTDQWAIITWNSQPTLCRENKTN